MVPSGCIAVGVKALIRFVTLHTQCHSAADELHESNEILKSRGFRRLGLKCWADLVDFKILFDPVLMLQGSYPRSDEKVTSMIRCIIQTGFWAVA